MGIKNKVAIVFAASKGLGKATAISLAQEGCKIAICSRDEEKLNNAAKEISAQSGSEVFAHTVDLEFKNQIDTFIKSVAEKWGAIDILINNAGGPPVASLDQTTEEGWHKWYEITFMSAVRSIKAALPWLKKDNWGRIINITSSSVKASIEDLIYSNSIRMAVVGLAKSLSVELGPFGITVHNVAPGSYLTDGLERIIKSKVEQGAERENLLNEWTKKIPAGRLGEPEELAALITFLASGRSAYLSGTTILADGGRYLGTY